MSSYQSRRDFKAESDHTNIYGATKQRASGLEMLGMNISRGPQSLKHSPNKNVDVCKLDKYKAVLISEWWPRTLLMPVYTTTLPILSLVRLVKTSSTPFFALSE